MRFSFFIYNIFYFLIKSIKQIIEICNKQFSLIENNWTSFFRYDKLIHKRIREVHYEEHDNWETN